MSKEEKIYSNDYADFMINLLEETSSKNLVIEEGEISKITNQIAILHYPRKRNTFIDIEKIPYSSIPKLYGLMDLTGVKEVGVYSVQNKKGLGLTGKDVLVGIIDTGIDYTNPLFMDAFGKTRILEIWDQSIPSERENNAFVSYGSIYTKEELDEAIKSDDPNRMVPSIDENGHGTFLAGIAAGGEDVENEFSGIAKESRLLIVKLKEAKTYLKTFYGIKQDVPAYEETDLIYAIQYFINYAQKVKLPISILIGVGTSNGGHLGYTFLERFLSDILENAGIMVSVPAGNEGSARLHFAGDMKEDVEYDVIECNIDEKQEMITFEFWGDIPTTYAMGFISPQGDKIEKIPPRFGTEEWIRLPLSNTSIYVAYQMIETYSGNQLIFVRMKNPTPGIWKILIYADEGRKRTYHMWMPLRQFLETETYFLNANAENTITSPGNINPVMTLTAYQHLNESIYANASRGYLTRTLGKPDLAAPGVKIMGPGLRKNFVAKTGTSISASYSAGMLALFLEWNMKNSELGIFYAPQIQSLFLKNAVRNFEIEYPNTVWGACGYIMSYDKKVIDN